MLRAGRSCSSCVRHVDARRFDRAVATRTSTQKAAIPIVPRMIRPQAGKPHSVAEEDSRPKMPEIRTYAPPLARSADETINAQNQAARDLGAKLSAYTLGNPNAMTGSSPDSTVWLSTLRTICSTASTGTSRNSSTSRSPPRSTPRNLIRSQPCLLPGFLAPIIC